MVSMLKNNLIILFPLFCPIFNEYIGPNEKITFQGATQKTFTISTMPSRYYIYYIYLTVLLIPKNSEIPNPILLIGTDNQCKKRLYAGTQSYEPIYSFINLYQFQSDLYICVQNLPLNQGYTIEVENKGRVYLPFNKQISYYISDENEEEIYFALQSNGIEIHEISIWSKGRNFDMKIVGNNDFEKKILHDGILYYGFSSKNEILVYIKGSIGEYITLGSTNFPLNGKIDYLKENYNEMVVASEHRTICFSILFPDYLNFIKGKTYMNKASSYFVDSNRNRIDIIGKDLKSKIDNGIINEQNVRGNYTEGLFCLNYNSQFSIISIQITSNRIIHIAQYPLIPGLKILN